MVERTARDGGWSRRRFLGRTGLALGAGLSGGLVSCTEADDPLVAAPLPDGSEALACAGTFFTPAEASVVEALASRILPGTPEDPGAREAGVIRYIDCLLGSGDGYGQPVYRQPPFVAPEPDDLAPLRADPSLALPPLVTGGEPEDPPAEQPTPLEASQDDDRIEATGYGVIPIPRSTFDRYGNQSLLTYRELYRRGVAALQAHSRERFAAGFAELDEGAQDQLVEDLAEDRAPGFDVPSAQGFFALVRRHTIEGMFADPMYGGNGGLAGWRLIGFPGAQRAYTAVEVRTPGLRKEPQALADLHAFHPGHAQGDAPTLPVSGSRRGGFAPPGGR